jgi:hypothetical protein
LSKLADVATGNALISGGVGVAPSYGKIGLTTHVSGTLPTANGGTNLTSFTANGVVYASSTSALATGSALTFDGSTLATTGALTVDGNTTLGNASTDTVQVSGTLGVGAAAQSKIGIYIAGNTDSVSTDPYGVRVARTITSNATSGFFAYSTQGLSTEASAFTIANVVGFSAINVTKGAGSTITNQIGVSIADQTQGTNNYGIFSSVSSGTNKWNIYANGTAANFFAGQSQFANGAVGTPSISNINDTNTGIFFPAADELAISTAGAQRVYLTSNGNMRLNSTANAGSNGTGLAIYASDFPRMTLRNSTTGDTTSDGFQMYMVGNDLTYNLLESGFQAWFTSNAERMRLDSAGNLGLGVTPSAWGTTAIGTNTRAFEISQLGSGLAAGGGAINLNNNVYTTNAGSFYARAGLRATQYQQNTGSGEHRWTISAIGTNAGDPITFTQAMTLDASGRLLLGYTSAPTGSGFAADTGTDSFRIAGDTAATLLLEDQAETTRPFQVLSSDGGALIFSNANRSGTGTTNTTERMRIDSAGNTLIGTTTNTNSSRLTVAGTISETVGSTQYLVASQYDVGTAANQIPLNQYLGSMAYQDSASINVANINGASDVLTIGNGQIVKDAVGNVGIGTSSPGSLLHVSSSQNGNGPVINIANTFYAASSTDERVDFQGEFYQNDVAANRSAGYLRFGKVGDFSDNANASSFFAVATRNAGTLAEKMRLDNAGNLGLGVTPSAWGNGVSMQGNAWAISTTSGTDSAAFTVNARQTAYGAGGQNYVYRTTAPASNYEQTAGQHRWYNAPSGTAGNAITFTQAMTLDASGRLLIGATASRAFGGFGQGNFQIETAVSSALGTLISNRNDTGASVFGFGKSRGTAVASNTVVVSGDPLGTINWSGADGTGLITAASIAAAVDGTPGTNDMPGRLVFSTTADGGSSSTERMRINNAGITQFNSNLVMPYQGAPTSKAALATLTGAELITGILNTTGTTYTITLPTGTDIEGALTWSANNVALDWWVINTASGTITIGANGNTTLGTLTIATGVSAHFRIRRTAANTFTVYRLS